MALALKPAYARGDKGIKVSSSPRIVYAGKSLNKENRIAKLL
jgi:hypothetical protein